MADGRTYRRGSVFGALLLIAIGGLFLYANLKPEFSPWPILAKYWPVLIIFWGLGKLVDYLMLRGRPEAAAATRISGGDIVGLIFLIIIGTAFSRAVEHGWRTGPIVIGDEEIGCLFGNSYEFTEELQQDIPPASTLNLSNLRGDVTLTAHAGDQLRLLARKTVCAPSESEAQRLADRAAPVLEEQEEGYVFHWETESGTTGLMSIDLDVQVPKRVNLKLSAHRGDLQVSGVQGHVAVELARGDAQVDEIEGALRVQIRRGSVHVADIRGDVEVEGRGSEIQIRNTTGTVSLEGEFYGPIHFANIAGEARFLSRRTNFTAARIAGAMTIDSGQLSVRGVPGDVTLLTRDKEIEVDEVAGQIRIENRNGRVAVRASSPPTNPIEVENKRGSIELVLPEGSNVRVSATTRKGSIETDFADFTVEEQSGGTETLSGSLGTGGTPIRLNTSYGTIYVRRGS